MPAVPPLQDESGRGADSDSTAGTGGVHEDTHQVVWEINAPGWSSPPAFSNFAEHRPGARSPVGASGEVVFDVFLFPVLRLSHAAALLLLQGMSPQALFPLDAYLVQSQGSLHHTWHWGPFFYLRGTFTPTWVPVALRDAVLVCVKKVPKETSREDLLSALLSAVS